MRFVGPRNILERHLCRSFVDAFRTALSEGKDSLRPHPLHPPHDDQPDDEQKHPREDAEERIHPGVVFFGDGKPYFLVIPVLHNGRVDIGEGDHESLDGHGLAARHRNVDRFFQDPVKIIVVEIRFLDCRVVDQSLFEKRLVLGVVELVLGPLLGAKERHHDEHPEDDRGPAQDNLEHLSPVEVVVPAKLVLRRAVSPGPGKFSAQLLVVHTFQVLRVVFHV